MQPKKKDMLVNPHQKVVLMYQAVIDMINEGYDINIIKVADITARAGIGKGTAYEYFSTKEEIITKALLYSMMNHMSKMQEITERADSFEQKFKDLLGYGAEHFHEGRTFIQVLKIIVGAYDISDLLKMEFRQVKEENVCSQFIQIQDAVMQAGVEQNIIKETNVFLQRMVFNSQLMAFCMFLTNKGNMAEANLTLEEAKQYIYDCTVKLLGE